MLSGMKTPWWLAPVLLVGLFACGSCEDDPTDCTANLDCLAGEDCVDGKCVPATVAECVDSFDCATGKVCVSGVCQTRPRADGGPVLLSDGGFTSSSSSGGMGGQGVIQLTPPDVLDFGSPVVGLDIPKSVLVKNVGAGALHIFSVGRTSGTSAEFSVTTSVPTPVVLGVGQEMRINVVYRLADGDADIGSINITSDASGCTFQCTDPENVRVALFSEFKGVRNLELTPSLHDFGFIQQGMSSAAFNFVARNDGTQTKLLTIQSITLTGADSHHFTLDSAVMAPTYLAPLAELQLPVTYTPVSQGEHTAELVVRANSDNPARTELRATITGRSVPTVDITADPIDFGHVMINQSATRQTTIRNNSNVSVSITGGSFVNGSATQNFFVPPPSPFPITITAGNSTMLDIVFRPMGMAGPRNDTLRLNHTLGAGPVNVGLTGYADPLPPPPGGPDLAISMTFTRADVEDNGCNASSHYNWQNMDLILEGGGGTCEKPASAAEIGNRCQTEAQCTCNFGTQGGGTWRASGGVSPEPYTNESIVHNQSGGDGNFMVKNRYANDCTDDWDNNSTAVIQAICGYGGSPPYRYMCFPRDKYPYLYVECGEPGPPYYGYCMSETSCLNASYGISGGECEANQPSTAKTVVTIKSAAGTVVEQRAFCRRFPQASTVKQDVVQIVRQQGNFRIGSVTAGVTEVGISASCP